MLEIILAPFSLLVGTAVTIIGWQVKSLVLLYGGASLFVCVLAALLGVPDIVREFLSG